MLIYHKEFYYTVEMPVCNQDHSLYFKNWYAYKY